MTTALQADRTLSITTPLGDDVLLLRTMTATEQLGRPFEFELDLLSGDEQIKFEDLLGQTMTVQLSLVEGEARYFNGYVSNFSQIGRVGDYARYQATLKPWLWFLTRTADCRIFQEKTVPDIIKEIFREHGFSDFDELLNADYRPWDYCVQYRETDFNFVSRLMEQEGIYYFFKHADGKHTLVLCDAYSSHQLIEGYEQVPYYPPSDNVVREEHINDWFLSKEIQPGTYALNDFDFQRPKAVLEVKSVIKREHALADYEVYDAPGEYVQTADGETYAKTRIEELQAQHEVIHGEGDARGLAVGGLFELTGYPRDDQNREYLITSATHQLRSDEYETMEAGEPGPHYACTFSVIDSKQPFRAPRTTPKPFVQGPQTAIVVGKSGEEIWTDKYGRVKVQFHWDRYGKSDENSSCWVRVSHPWAGKSWGSIAIPRIGQEVIVDFLEGDPDQPIITGRTYNADCMPPYGLPGGQVISGTKSNSTKGGGGYNELVMDDTKGNELIRVHGQYDMDSTIEHDLREHVLNNRSRDVTVDETITIGNNETVAVGVNRTETVGSNETVSVGSNRSISVGASETKTVALQRTHAVGVNETITIGAAQEVAIGAFQAVAVGAYQTVNVGLNQSVDVGSNQSVDVGKNASMSVGGDESRSVKGARSTDIGKDNALKVGKNLIINAGDSVTITTGSASISMKKDGTIVIKGKDITVEGSGKINVKASDNIVMKGSKILQN
ncbi:MAG: type VI secretion system Vgr family protein [Gammaproteobacteria bacterium]